MLDWILGAVGLCHANPTAASRPKPSDTIVVTGAAGFIGSHLVDALLKSGHHVLGFDNLLTGSLRNLREAKKHKNFTFYKMDVTDRLLFPAKEIYHLASPASPLKYFEYPTQTWKANTIVLAEKHKAKFLFASTSEVYGDPLVHPQKEDYYGNVNPIGERAIYDESKRAGEAIVSSFQREGRLSTRIARIFNTYGPRMDPLDGRVVTNFISALLNKQSIMVHGFGNQTRSFVYVGDLVDGLIRLMASDYTRPVNLGNPEEEITIMNLSQRIKTLMPDYKYNVKMTRARSDDPSRRKPDISVAKTQLHWKPTVSLTEGLKRTIAYLSKETV